MIIITESQLELIRRIYDIEKYVDLAIDFLKFKKPKNFGIYERNIINIVEMFLLTNYPNLKYTWEEITLLISKHFNSKLKDGFRKSKNNENINN